MAQPPRSPVPKAEAEREACNSDPSSSSKGRSEKPVSAATDDEMLVPPWVLLAFVLVLGGIFMARLGQPQSLPESVAGSEASENTSVLLLALPIVAGYSLVIVAALVLPGILGTEATIWAMLAALGLVMTRRWWTATLVKAAMLVSTSPASCLALVVAVCFLLFIFVQVASALCFKKEMEAGAPNQMSRLSRLRPDVSRSTCKQQQLPLHPMHRAAGSQVLLHIYDVTHNKGIRSFNSLLSNRHSLLKIGGLFHIGVEVYGREWCFGYCDAGSGVTGITPKKNKLHHFRETVCLQTTSLSEERVLGIIRDLQAEYKGADYGMLQRNCCHFAEDLCNRLEVGGWPLWVNRLARAASWLRDRLAPIYELFEAKLGPLSQCVKIAPQL